MSFYLETHDFRNGLFNWIDVLPHIEAAQNNCFYPHLPSTPYEMRFGVPMQHPLENSLELCDHDDHDTRDLRTYKDMLSVRKFQLLNSNLVAFLWFHRS